MKVRNLSVAALIAATVVSAQAQTQGSGWYGEIGYLALTMKNDYSSGSTTATPSLARFVLGKEFGSDFAVEAMFGTTVKSETVGTTKVSDSFSALYIKPSMSVSDGTKIFARLGYANNEGKAEKGTTSSWSSSKPSYGFGIQTQFTKDVYGAIDYMDYGKKTFDTATSSSSIKHSGITLSVGMRF